MQVSKKTSLEVELKDILNDMQVPIYRKELTIQNLTWLHRNLGIQNNQHSSFDRAMAIIQFLLNPSVDGQVYDK